jgi:hypothetical protein
VLAHVLPDGIGRELAAHTRLYIQIHYDTGHGIQPDRSTLDIMLEDKVARVERGIPVGNPLWFVGNGMKIAAGDPDTKVWFDYDPTSVVTQGAPVEVHNVMLHMHELGSIGRVAVLRKDGSTECLLNITKWDFHWLGDYYFETPVRIDPGDKVYVECHWDNTADHQKIVMAPAPAPRICTGVLTTMCARSDVQRGAVRRLACWRSSGAARHRPTARRGSLRPATPSGWRAAPGRSRQAPGEPLPELAIAGRRGVRSLEVQVNGTMLPIKQLRTGSLELAGKLRLIEHGRWSLAAGAGAGYRIAESGGASIEGVYASAPVIGGVELGRHQLVVSVTGGFQRWYSSGARRVDVPFVGESIGFLWQVSERWALLPEAGAAWTPAPNFMTASSRLFHVGIAALWTR